VGVSGTEATDEQVGCFHNKGGDETIGGKKAFFSVFFFSPDNSCLLAIRASFVQVSTQQRPSCSCLFGGGHIIP